MRHFFTMLQAEGELSPAPQLEFIEV
jgi:hypothetical protein